MNNSNNLEKNELFALAIENHAKNKLEVAKDLYEDVLKIDPKYIKALNNLGVLYQSTKNYKKAKNYYEKAIEIHYNYDDAHTNLGIVFKILNDLPRATLSFQKAIEINPHHTNANYNLGSNFETLGDYKKAKIFYKKVIEINPNYFNAYNSLANLFIKLSEFEKAKSYYKKVIEADPNNLIALNGLGFLLYKIGKNKKAKIFFDKVLKFNPNFIDAQKNINTLYISELLDLEKATNSSYKTLKMIKSNSNFIDQSISLFRLKHDFEQAKYISQPRGYWKFFKSKNYEIEGIEKFQKVSDEILSRSENKENENNYDKKIFLNKDEINDLLPFYRSDYTYKTKKISGSCINPNKNWQEVEDKYLNGSNQIIYIDDFLSEEALQELREFCLVSKVWNREYKNKYLGAFSNSGFISPIHLQIAIDLKKQLPKLFGPHRVAKIWGFKYDSKMGKGINVHADAAIHNLNFWITPDEYNNNKNSGGLKVYDTPAPEKWSFEDYNSNKHNIYQFLKDNNANCTNVSYKSNRAVLFDSSYFHETDEIDFKDEYEGRRIANTYLFGSRRVEKK